MPAIAVVIFLVAIVYASVGHGGASGYLAALTLFGYDPALMASSALILNIFVAGTACLAFWSAGHGSWRVLWPFAITSVPLAFLGGWMRLPLQVYDGLLAVTLMLAAVRLWLPDVSTVGSVQPPRLTIALPTGGLIGWLSGAVGVGGGIFLSPIMLLCRWADPKRTAAISAAFIVINSAAGLAGRFATGGLLIGNLWLLVAAAFAGGWIGSRLGARHLPGSWLRRILALVLVMAAIKGLVT